MRRAIENARILADTLGIVADAQERIEKSTVATGDALAEIARIGSTVPDGSLGASLPGGGAPAPGIGGGGSGGGGGTGVTGDGGFFRMLAQNGCREESIGWLMPNGDQITIRAMVCPFYIRGTNVFPLPGQLESSPGPSSSSSGGGGEGGPQTGGGAPPPIYNPGAVDRGKPITFSSGAEANGGLDGKAMIGELQAIGREIGGLRRDLRQPANAADGRSRAEGNF